LKRAYEKFAFVSAAFATMVPSDLTTSTLSTSKSWRYSAILASVASNPVSFAAMKATLIAFD